MTLSLPLLPARGVCVWHCASLPYLVLLQVGKQRCFRTVACYRRKAVGKGLFSNLSVTWLKVFLTSNAGIADILDDMSANRLLCNQII